MPHEEISEEELLLRKRARRRLIGAFVVVSAMVLILPAVLEDKPQPVSRDVSIILPPAITQPVPPIEIPPAPLAEKRAASSDPQATSATANPGELDQPPAPVPVPKSSPAEAPVKSAAPAKSSSAPAGKAATERFQVQIGVFSNSENVKQLQSKLGAQGVTVRTEILADGKIRVRSGPYTSRTEADKVAEQLRSLGTQGVVIKTGDKSSKARQ